MMPPTSRIDMRHFEAVKALPFAFTNALLFFHGQFRHLIEQIGEYLQRTQQSLQVVPTRIPRVYHVYTTCIPRVPVYLRIFLQRPDGR